MSLLTRIEIIIPAVIVDWHSVGIRGERTLFWVKATRIVSVLQAIIVFRFTTIVMCGWAFNVFRDQLWILRNSIRDAHTYDFGILCSLLRWTWWCIVYCVNRVIDSFCIVRVMKAITMHRSPILPPPSPSADLYGLASRRFTHCLIKSICLIVQIQFSFHVSANCFSIYSIVNVERVDFGLPLESSSGIFLWKRNL